MSEMKLVAIIDDDASVRRATSSLVRSFGFSAVTFESAEAFLGSPQRADVSCVVCDVHMPGMSGVDLLDEMALEGRNTPMIFITAYTEERVRRRAGPSACILHKPFEAVDLAASLDDAVRPHG